MVPTPLFTVPQTPVPVFEDLFIVIMFDIFGQAFFLFSFQFDSETFLESAIERQSNEEELQSNEK